MALKKMPLRRLDGLRSQERGLGARQAPFAGRGGATLDAHFQLLGARGTLCDWQSWKSAELLNFGPACYTGAVTKSGALGTHPVAA
jgi:hypothetical protein